MISWFFIIGLLSSMSCASSGGGISKSGGKNGQYYEDLSSYRPDYSDALDTLEADRSSTSANETEIITDPQYDATEEINMLLDSISFLKANINYVDGYTVQVYTGINREQANEAKATVYKTLPDSRPVIIYDQPNFKVKVGQFYTRREALKTFAELKNAMPGVIIIPERIPVASSNE